MNVNYHRPGRFEQRRWCTFPATTIVSSSSAEATTRRRNRSSRSKSPGKRHKKSKRDTPDHVTPPPKQPTLEETEEEYDLRLEREENERLEAARLEKLQKMTAQLAEPLQSKGGVRFKGAIRLEKVVWSKPNNVHRSRPHDFCWSRNSKELMDSLQ